MGFRRKLSVRSATRMMIPPTISWLHARSRARSGRNSLRRWGSSISHPALAPPLQIGGCRLGPTSQRHYGEDLTHSFCSFPRSSGRSTTDAPSTASSEPPRRSLTPSARKPTPVSQPGSGP
jgi:hypothetical protein